MVTNIRQEVEKFTKENVYMKPPFFIIYKSQKLLCINTKILHVIINSKYYSTLQYTNL